MATKSIPLLPRSNILALNIHQVQDFTRWPRTYEITLEGPKKISNRFYFKHFTGRDLQNINLERKRRYYIKTVRLSTCEDPSLLTESISFLKMNQHKKYLKHMNLLRFDWDQGFDQAFHHILYQCRFAQKLELNIFLSNGILESLDGIINKRIRGISLLTKGHDNEYSSRLYHVLKKKPVRHLSYENLGACFRHNAREEIQKLFCKVMRLLSRMKLLESIQLAPSCAYLQSGFSYEDALNGLPRLKELDLSRIVPKDLKYANAIGNSKAEFLINKFYSNLTNVDKLTKLQLMLLPNAAPLISRIFNNSQGLKDLILNYDVEEYCVCDTTKLSELQYAWENIANLTSLEYLNITYGREILSIQPVSGLTNLKRLSIDAYYLTNARLLEYGDIGKAISGMVDLQYLRIHGYFHSSGFEDFLKSDSKCLNQLEEIDFAFPYNQDVIIGKELVSWFSSKTKTKYLHFIVGPQSEDNMEAIIPAQTVKNCCEAFLTLKNLSSLKFCLGSTFSTNSISFAPNDNNYLISELLHNLKGIKKLIIRVAGGYFTDSEIRRIMSTLSNMHELRMLGFGGCCKKVSDKAASEMIDFVERMKSTKLRKLVLWPIGTSSEIRHRLNGLLRQYYNTDSYVLVNELEM